MSDTQMRIIERIADYEARPVLTAEVRHEMFDDEPVVIAEVHASRGDGREIILRDRHYDELNAIAAVAGMIIQATVWQGKETSMIGSE